MKKLRRLVRRTRRRILEALHRSDLRRVDSRPIPEGKDEIRAFVVVRNEAGFLPTFLRFHSELGVDRFFFVDNGSTDGTGRVLAERENVHVFHTTGSYKSARNGCIWRDQLLWRFGRGRWCVVLDGDELFIYPGYEDHSLRELCSHLQAEGALGLNALWVQMYSDRPLRETRWRPGEDALEICPFFDRNSCEPVPHPPAFGWPFFIRKAPLHFGGGDGPSLTVGQHQFSWGHRERRESKIRAAVLHFKFTEALYHKAREEMQRRQYHRSDLKYGGFYRKLTERPDLSLVHEDSLRFAGSRQMVDLGIMRTVDNLFRAGVSPRGGSTSPSS